MEGIQKKKQFFVFTSAGKPVWTRYGDQTDHSTFIGSLAAIIYKFQHYYTGVEDSLQYLRTKDMFVVFLSKQALYYVCISKSSCSLASLVYQLNMLHSKIISTLTDNITSMLVSRPSYDARVLMGGTHISLNTLIQTCAASPSFIQGIMPVRMNMQTRNQIFNIFKNHTHQDLVYGFLMTTSYIIYKYTGRGAEVCRPIDIILLNNLLASNTSLKSKMSWTPICLPGFSDKGFLYAYITFIQNSEICLALISDNASAFKPLKDCGDLIQRDLLPLLGSLHQSIASMPYPVGITDIKELKHFIYFSKSNQQYTMSGFSPSTRECLPEISLEHYKKMLCRYSSAYNLSNFNEFYRGYFFRINNYRNEQIVCQKEKEFVLLASFSPLVPISVVVSSVSQLLKFVKQEEGNFFIIK